jgi:Rap1a immunity proteins
MNHSAAFVLLAVTVVAPAYGVDSQSLMNWDPTGNDLVASCSAEIGSYENGACLGFIHGVIGGFNSGTTIQRGRGNDRDSILDLCVPNVVSNGQITKVVLAYTDKHPEQLHYPADIIVTKAIGEAWPLEKSLTRGHACFSEGR